MDVIICAAPDLPVKKSFHDIRNNVTPTVKITDKELLEIHKKPEVVARAVKEVMAEYLHAFKTIEFAVYCPPQNDTNFKVFKRVLSGLEK